MVDAQPHFPICICKYFCFELNKHKHNDIQFRIQLLNLNLFEIDVLALLVIMALIVINNMTHVQVIHVIMEELVFELLHYNIYVLVHQV